MSAYEELLEFLETGEEIKAVVFGDERGGERYVKDVKVPLDKLGVVLSPEEAAPLLRELSGLVKDGYPFFVWTNRRVIFVARYRGLGFLKAAPLYPATCKPEYFGL